MTAVWFLIGWATAVVSMVGAVLFVVWYVARIPPADEPPVEGRRYTGIER